MVNTICLPNDYHSSPESEKAIYYGFGFVDDRNGSQNGLTGIKGTPTEILQKGETVLNSSGCYENMFCAHYAKNDRTSAKICEVFADLAIHYIF